MFWNIFWAAQWHKSSKMKINLPQILAITTLLVESVVSLECYVCTDQDGNAEKCRQTLKVCEYEETRCMTTIRWSTTPYWTEGAEYQYYVTKRCATEHTCEHEISKTMPICHYIWYEDWKCAECCLGDRCNYYVTLGSSSVKSNTLILATMTVLSLWMFWRWCWRWCWSDQRLMNQYTVSLKTKKQVWQLCETKTYCK